MADQSDPNEGQTKEIGGCAGAHKAWLEGKAGTFHMKAQPVPKIEPPPPVPAKPLPPTNELYVICGKNEIGDRRGKSFPVDATVGRRQAQALGCFHRPHGQAIFRL